MTEEQLVEIETRAREWYTHPGEAALAQIELQEVIPALCTALRQAHAVAQVLTDALARQEGETLALRALVIQVAGAWHAVRWRRTWDDLPAETRAALEAATGWDLEDQEREMFARDAAVGGRTRDD